MSHQSPLSSSSSSQHSLLPLWRRWVARKRTTAAPGRNRRPTSEKHSFSWRPWDRKYQSCSPDRATSRYRLPSPGQRLPGTGQRHKRTSPPESGSHPEVRGGRSITAGAVIHGSRCQAAPKQLLPTSPTASSRAALPFPPSLEACAAARFSFCSFPAERSGLLLLQGQARSRDGSGRGILIISHIFSS